MPSRIGVPPAASAVELTTLSRAQRAATAPMRGLTTDIDAWKPELFARAYDRSSGDLDQDPCARGHDAAWIDVRARPAHLRGRGRAGRCRGRVPHGREPCPADL